MGFAVDVCRLVRTSVHGGVCTRVLSWLRSSLFDMLKLLDVRRIRSQHLLKLHCQLRTGLQHLRNELRDLVRPGLLILQQLRHATSNASPRLRL